MCVIDAVQPYLYLELEGVLVVLIHVLKEREPVIYWLQVNIVVMSVFEVMDDSTLTSANVAVDTNEYHNEVMIGESVGSFNFYSRGNRYKKRGYLGD